MKKNNQEKCQDTNQSCLGLLNTFKETGGGLLFYSLRNMYSKCDVCVQKITLKSSINTKYEQTAWKGKELTMQTISDSFNWEDNAGSQSFWSLKISSSATINMVK